LIFHSSTISIQRYVSTYCLFSFLPSTHYVVFIIYTRYCYKPDVKVKAKFTPRTGHEGPEDEYRYSSPLSLTSVLDGGRWAMPYPGHFTPGKDTWYPLYRRLGGPYGQSGQVINLMFLMKFAIKEIC
jgi:hypothetical protein